MDKTTTKKTARVQLICGLWNMHIVRAGPETASVLTICYHVWYSYQTINEFLSLTCTCMHAPEYRIKVS